MNFSGLAFIFITYAVLKAMVLADVTGVPLEEEIPSIPIFEYNQTEIDELFDFVTVSGVDAIAEAVQNVAIAIVGGFKVIVASVLFLFDMLVFVGQLVGFILTSAVTGVDGPWYIDALIGLPMIIIATVMIYKLLRSGDDEQ